MSDYGQLATVAAVAIGNGVPGRIDDRVGDAREGQRRFGIVPIVPNLSAKPLILLNGAPYGNRTRVSAVKGRCPRPLDEGREKEAIAA